MVDKLANFEPILEYLGVLGKYQLLQIGLQLLGQFSLSFVVLGVFFTGYEPPHQCSPINLTHFAREHSLADNSSIDVTYNKCDIQVKVNATNGNMTSYTLDCVNGHDYYGQKHVSFVAEMDLVCAKDGLGELTQLLLVIGQGVGSFVFTIIADRYGRKPVYVVTACVVAILHALCGTAPNFLALAALRFLIGAFQQGVMLTCTTLFIEMVPPGSRKLVILLFGTVWSSSLIVLALMSWVLRHQSWRMLQYVMVATPGVCLVLPWCLAESPRWLASNNRADDALAILKKWCRWNGKDFGHVKKLFDIHVVEKIRVDQAKEQTEAPQPIELRVERYSVLDMFKHKPIELRVERYSVVDMFKHTSIFIINAILGFVWTSVSLTYYGLTLTSSTLAKDRYLHFFLSSLAEWPAHTVGYFMLKTLKRKAVETLFLILSAIFLLSASLLLLGGGATYTTASTAFILLGKFSVMVAYDCLYVYTPELYPTNLRSVGLGLASTMSRLGGMVAPFAKFLIQVVIYGPAVIFGSMCLVSAILVQLLPETKGRALPSTIKEVKSWRRNNGSGSKVGFETSRDEEFFFPPKDEDDGKADTKGLPEDNLNPRFSQVERWMHEDLEESMLT